MANHIKEQPESSTDHLTSQNTYPSGTEQTDDFSFPITFHHSHAGDGALHVSVNQAHIIKKMDELPSQEDFLEEFAYAYGGDTEDPTLYEYPDLFCADGSMQGGIYMVLLDVTVANPDGATSRYENANGQWANHYEDSYLFQASSICHLVALFISGGVVTAVSLVISLLAQAAFSPAIPIEYSMMQVIGISNADFLSSLYYTHPWIYCICWCGVQFLFGGTAAVTVFLFGRRLRFVPLAILLPYGLFYCLAALGTLLDAFVDVTFEANILHLVMAAPLSHTPSWLIFSYLGVLICISYLAVFFQVVHHDLL